MMGFIDQMRAEGHAVESIVRVLREQGVKVAARTYRAWRRPRIAVRTISDATVVDAVRAAAWTTELRGDGTTRRRMLGGAATDRWGADRTLLFGVAVIVAAMAGLWAIWLARPAPSPLVLAVATVWGAMAFWNSPRSRPAYTRSPVRLRPRRSRSTPPAPTSESRSAKRSEGSRCPGQESGSLPLLAAALAICALLLLGGARTGGQQTIRGSSRS